MTKMGNFRILLLSVFISVCLANKFKLECLNGDWHKKAPSAESNLAACHRYSELSCCHQGTSQWVAQSDQRIGDFSWNHCGKLSSSCHKYMRRMECFYQCSPYTSLWKHENRKGGIFKVPICGSFCEDWYSACKDDETCVRNWLSDFEFDEVKVKDNTCPKGSTCRKFSDVFMNGTDLCNHMWGDSLEYVDKDVHSDACFDVDFEGRNPNWAVATKKHIRSYLKTNHQWTRTSSRRKIMKTFNKCALGQLKENEKKRDAETRDERVFYNARERVDKLITNEDECSTFRHAKTKEDKKGEKHSTMMI